MAIGSPPITWDLKHTGELWVYIGAPLPNPSGNTGVMVCVMVLEFDCFFFGDMVGSLTERLAVALRVACSIPTRNKLFVWPTDSCSGSLAVCVHPPSGKNGRLGQALTNQNPTVPATRDLQ